MVLDKKEGCMWKNTNSSNLPLCRKLNIRWIKDLNMRPSTQNPIEGKVETSTELTGTEDFPSRILIA